MSDAQILRWREAVDAIQADASRLVQDLDESQLNWRASEGRWSVAECLAHLAIAGSLLLHRIQPILLEARKNGRRGQSPYRLGLVGGWFARAMEEAGNRPLKAPKNFVPPSELNGHQVVDRFITIQETLRLVLEDADGLPLDRIRVGSVAEGAGWLRLNVAAWIASTLAHERRHLKQAWKVRNATNFPSRSEPARRPPHVNSRDWAEPGR